MNINSDYSWLEKKTPRSIEQLKLWDGNPRLKNPEEPHITIADFVEDLISDENDKKHFFDLLRSIAEGFIPADPIVVWQGSDHRFYVAEGNRRVLALKLLQNPDRAPKSIRAYVRRVSEMRQERYDKIKVCVAPSFEAAEWYINQRNSTSSLQLPWSRIQQQKWIERLYKQYGNDIPTLLAKTSMSRGELENYIRNLRLIDLINTSEVKEALTDQEYAKATSHKFPITILERFFSNSNVKEAWGVETEGLDFKLKNKHGFLVAYAQLIKNIVADKPAVIIDTRTVTSNLEEILNQLPMVNLETTDAYVVKSIPQANNQSSKEEQHVQTITHTVETKNDINRRFLIHHSYVLNTEDNRINSIFNELKKLTLNQYPNAAAASIRILLELSVNNWFDTYGLTQALCSQNQDKELRDITLSRKLTFISNVFEEKHNKEIPKLINRLCNKSNEHSLDVLNGYQHSKDSYYISKQFINGFWDFLFPLFEVLLDIKEIQE